ncbi:MAG: hypothetical protein JWM40_2854 [Frankiales bacterium]|nr:hypothetical protein [Frankiales bacterium]
MSGSARNRLAPALAALAIMLVVVGVWVGTGATRDGSDLPPLTSQAPSGFVSDPVASGPVDTRAAASATVLPTDVLRPLLDRAGVRRGRVRRWTATDQFAEVIVLRTRSDAAARDLVGRVLAYVKGLPGGGVAAGDAALFAVPAVVGAQGYLANGEATSTSAPLFVQGVLLVRGRDLFVLETGGAAPGDTTLVVQLAERQARLVAA